MKKKIYAILILTFLSFNIYVHAQNMGLHFDGIDDYIATTYNTDLSSWTVECWVKGDAAPSTTNIERVVHRGSNFAINWGHGNANFRGTIEFYNEVSEFITERTYFAASFGTLEADVWYHLVGTYDGLDLKAYKNGVLITTNDIPHGAAVTDATTLVIGSSGGTNPFAGKIDEVRIWSDVRTETEIRANMYQELTGSESNLVSYYKLNETSGTNANDSQSSSNYDGTLTNMAESAWIPSSAFFGPKSCYQFNGSNSYVSLGNDLYNNNFSGGNAISIEYWFKGTVLQSAVRFQGWDVNYGNDYVVAGWGGTNPTFIISTDGGSGNGVLIGSDAVLEDGNWHHIACTWEKNTTNGFKTYVDGVLSNQRTSANVNLPTIVYNGLLGAYHGPTEVLNGQLDEVRIWTDVRTEAEICENMNKTLIGNEAGLIAYYNLDNGNVATNIASINYDGATANITSVASTAFNTWLNTNSADAASTSNWSLGSLPTSSNNVGIYSHSGSDPAISSTFGCNHFYLESGASFTMNDGASFLPTGDEYINGTYTLNKTIAEDSKWHLISMPNNNTTSSTFDGYYLQQWDEASATWSNITELDEAMTPVKGYSLFDTPAKTSFSFVGTPNTGEQTYSLTYNDNAGTSDGMNLIGNPYPSAIDLNVIDPSYGAFHIWNPASDDYEEYNGGSGSIRYLAPLQGFFVYATSNETFTIDNSARTHTGAGTFYKSTHTEIENGLIISTNQQDKLYIKLMDEASDDFDFIYDAYKIVSLGENNSQLYSKYFDTKMAIDCRPETEVIQLGYQNNQDGQYTIELIEMEGITSAEIEDTKLNQFHKLNQGAYIFDWSIEDNEERFILHLKATGVDDLSNNTTQIFAYQKTINIRSSEKLNNAQISIIDMMGRTVYEQALVDGQNELINLPLEDGVYLVQLVSDSGTEVEKVILR
ncbi:MAG: T9SS type A sorting domain-containing protein [Bacteroidales bacterium]|nr:T9SS type A sorting domain-containing protein [Bacteroidales bacterium]